MIALRSSHGQVTVSSLPAASGSDADRIDLKIRRVRVEGTDNGMRDLLGYDSAARNAVSAVGHLRFECDEDALLRAAPHSTVKIPAWPDLEDRRPAGVQRWCAWLHEVWAIPAVADAVRHASPDLSHDLDHLDPATILVPHAVRMVLRLGAYVLRLTSRPTPFGLFAGVAPASFSPAVTARWGANHRAVARAGGAWIADVVAQLEAVPEIRHRLAMVTNNTVMVRGGRIVVPWRPRDLDSTSTGIDEVSLLFTPEVRAVTVLAKSPVSYRDLVAKVRAGFSIDGPAAHALLDQLIECRVLLSSLQPPSTAIDALGYIVAELERSDAASEAVAASTIAALREVRQLMGKHNRLPAVLSAALRKVLVRRMSELSAADRALAVDVRLDCDVVLPRKVARETEAAAAVLTRVSPHPYGPGAWRDYHRRFLSRYGQHALVPVLDLLDPDVGLGYPQGYLGTGPVPVPPLSARDGRLLSLVELAALDGWDEIVLDEQLIRELTTGDAEEMRAPAHLEMAFEVRAASQTALSEGEFEIVVGSVTRGFGTMSGGRFAALLDPSGRDGVPAALGNLPTSELDALPVQLAFPALAPSATHITRTPQLLPALISVGEHRAPGPGVISLDDLVVGADDDRLFLMSHSYGQRLEAAAFHPLQLEFHTPTLVRFLSEIARGRAAVVTGFDWGAAAGLPFLPRVRYRRTVLSPARWLLDHTGLPDRAASTQEWNDALAALRARLRIPALVLLTYFDQRLRLDLDQSGHRAVLRSHLERPHVGPITLIEAAGPEVYGWLNGHPHEVVALLRAVQPADPWPIGSHLPEAAPVLPGTAQMPGDSSWLSIRLPARRQRQHDFVAHYLPELLAEFSNDGQDPLWWFAPQEDHLRLHLELAEADKFAKAVHRVSSLAQRLAVQRVVRGEDIEIVAYCPDTQWGTGALLRVAEEVFASDSRAVLEQVRHPAGLDPRVLSAANLIAISVAFTGSIPGGMRWLADRPVSAPASGTLPRPVQKEAVRVADPQGQFEVLRSIPGGAALTAGWPARREALTAYRASLIEHPHVDPDQVLDRLLHEHILRVDGSSSDSERTVRRLARSVALAHLARSPHQRQR
ncbi:lantibiotic dehydratase [Streptomyces polygonati]|uniref:Lantibiotic dehydratase n=1 Tax=Streptomyces polygonati TaxID=1617087 RepID=A0ABV8HY04_9ACTN